jgi:hypothetical protein
MKSRMLVVISLVVTCAILCALPAMAAPINPDGFERYALGRYYPDQSTVPSPKMDWLVDGLRFSGSANPDLLEEYSITTTAARTGSQGLYVKADDNANVNWNMPDSMSTSQIYSVDIRSQDNGWRRVDMFLRNDLGYLGYLDARADRIRAYGYDVNGISTYVNLPGPAPVGEYFPTGVWYKCEMQTLYNVNANPELTTGQFRCRYGVYAGDGTLAMNDWTSWLYLANAQNGSDYVSFLINDRWSMDNLTLTNVPEPGGLLALGIGLTGLVGMIRRRK